ncbi:MAG TPA: hypothetical protein DDW50_17340 [Firmicutes bacterium]|nr:hypothetical protein [Bacillota bacterium]
MIQGILFYGLKMDFFIIFLIITISSHIIHNISTKRGYIKITFSIILLYVFFNALFEGLFF